MTFTDKQAHSIWLNGEEVEAEVKTELQIYVKCSSMLLAE